ncbi:hypothetical protein LTR85_002679 [Meristemomyces frigidus]|nr:hypothetical protein LTR85_002679 [Meristemomyces frigidus]
MKRKADQAVEGPTAKATKLVHQTSQRDESRLSGYDQNTPRSDVISAEGQARGKRLPANKQEAEWQADNDVRAKHDERRTETNRIDEASEKGRNRKEGKKAHVDEFSLLEKPGSQPKADVKTGNLANGRKPHPVKQTDKPVEPAQELIDQLVLATELRRDIRRRRVQQGAVENKPVMKFLVERLSTLLRRLSQLATVPSISSEPSLQPLPAAWFSAMKRFHQAQKHTVRHNKSVDQARDEISEALEHIEADMIERTSVLLDSTDDDPWPYEAAELDEKINKGYDGLAEAEETYSRLTQELEAYSEAEATIGEKLLSRPMRYSRKLACWKIFEISIQRNPQQLKIIALLGLLPRKMSKPASRLRSPRNVSCASRSICPHGAQPCQRAAARRFPECTRY